MLATIRYDKALGNAGLYVRARDGAGRFWDWSALAWLDAETAACRTFLTEYQDSDPLQSLYMATVATPTGTGLLEYVLASEGRSLTDEPFTYMGLGPPPATTPGAYISVADVRAEGLTDTALYPDDLLLRRIRLAQQYIEKRTRRWFEARALTLFMNGNDGPMLHLGSPIIRLDALYMNWDFTTPVDPSRYTAHASRAEPDDRHNPRISLNVTRDWQARDIYRASWLDKPMRFAKGNRNQKLVGVFGYTEEDGSTPELIRYACLKLVLMYSGKLASSGLPPGPRRVIQSESTDGHSVAYGIGGAAGGGANSFHGDDEVESIIHQYRGPMRVAVPGSNSIEMG